MNQAKLKERELIIKLRKEGKTCVEVGKILGVSKGSVSYWDRRFQETGCLEDKPRPGRPTPLTEKRLHEMKEKIHESFLEQNGKAGLSSKEIRIFIEKETGKNYTIRHVERLLHKMGFTLITPRVHHIRKDERAQRRFKEEFKKNINKNMWTILS